MNNKIFKSHTNTIPTNTTNEHGAPAYSLNDKEALAQLVVTGTFNNTFYTNSTDQLQKVTELAKKVDPNFLAKLAIYARTKAFMKDSPAVLLAVLSTKDLALFKRVAPKVLNNMKMVRNFVQVLRSNSVGRKCLGSAPKKQIQAYFNKLTDEQLFNQSIGQSPSIADIIRLAHIKPNTTQRENLFKYLLGYKTYDLSKLPECVQKYEAFKADQTKPMPKVDWQMLAGFTLSTDQWKQIAANMNWHALRMNLNTLARHDVLKDSNLVNTISSKLLDTSTIAKINVFPYQLFNTYLNAKEMPTKISGAIQDALDASVTNVPRLENVTKLFVCIDVSGSMSSPVTGHRGTVSTSVRCSDAAAIFAASFAKKNDHIQTEIIAFDNTARKLSLNLRDSLVTIASSMNTPGGGTNCAAAMEYISANYTISKADSIAVIFISDNCSWAEYNYNDRYGRNSASPLALRWENVARRASSAKLVLIDIQPHVTTQHQTVDNNVMNIGGFSDAVFDVTSKFISNTSPNWTSVIENYKLDSYTEKTEQWDTPHE